MLYRLTTRSFDSFQSSRSHVPSTTPDLKNEDHLFSFTIVKNVTALDTRERSLTRDLLCTDMKVINFLARRRKMTTLSLAKVVLHLDQLYPRCVV